VAIVLVSVALSWLIVFHAEFGGRAGRAQTPGAIHSPSVETLLAYLVAFVVAGLLLTAFGEVDAPNGTSLAEVVVLSFPACMGAALGRLLV
jgi:uncharacterized membrane protein